MDIVNVLVWSEICECFRRTLNSGRLLRITSRMQLVSLVTHMIAHI